MRTPLIVVALIALAAPTAAGAAQITAGPSPVTYQNPNIEIDAGEAITLTNLDLTAAHDVTSIDVGPGATPLFASETIGFAASAPVNGAEALDPGTYDFLCSVHTFMTGSIKVRGAGGGSSSAPSLHLSALGSRLAKVERAGKLKLRTKLNQAATVNVVAKAADGTKVAAGRDKLDKGTGKLVAKLTSKGKRLVAKAKKLKLEITGRATDRDGNSSKSSLRLTLD
jgi:plastocyanin